MVLVKIIIIIIIIINNNNNKKKKKKKNCITDFQFYILKPFLNMLL